VRGRGRPHERGSAAERYAARLAIAVSCRRRAEERDEARVRRAAAACRHATSLRQSPNDVPRVVDAQASHYVTFSHARCERRYRRRACARRVACRGPRCEVRSRSAISPPSYFPRVLLQLQENAGECSHYVLMLRVEMRGTNDAAVHQPHCCAAAQDAAPLRAVSSPPVNDAI